MSARPKDTRPEPTGSHTRYAELASTLVTDIVDGRHVVGSLLPTEHELAQLHGVSRHTVRAALQRLQDLGYISRKKSVGTMVESVNPKASFTQSFGTVEDLVRVAATEVRAIEDVRTVTLDRAAARHLQAPVKSEWLVFSGTRVAAKKGGTPVAWAEIYVDTAFSRISQAIRDNPDVLVSALIERECGQSIAEIRQVVTGMLIGEPLAGKLGVPANSAGLRLIRHYKDAGGRILEITDTVYPADRVSVAFQLRRTQG
ncbi:GntR family transcriptional regulator [Cupriavidus sp. 2MCAB6]|uniref:GntR family transcriptional regulator n=1 Tax=Cupriavidus sp. 2MCAB6 TaxID=3232981 RepID=UPI003F90DFA9